jgi:competence transcription factor ComK
MDMTLGDLCEFKTNFPEADFWLIRKGSETMVGKPVKDFDSERIGVKVIQTDILNPQYLYYVFMSLQQGGKFIPLAHGTLKLKNISIRDIKNIRIG